MDQPQDPRREARNALNHGDLGEAQRLLAQVLKRQPNDDEAWTLMATAQTEPRRRQECLDRALNLNPGNTTALALRAAWAPQNEPDPVTVPVRTTQPSAPSPAYVAPEPVAPIAAADAGTMPRRPDRRTLIEQARLAPPSLQAAQTLAGLGQIAGARDMLWNVLEQDSSDESVWLALIDLIDDDRQRADVIEEAATRFPNSALLKAARSMATTAPTEPAPTTDALWPVTVKTPLELIQERANRTGENLGPIRARRVEVSTGQVFFEVWMSALMGPTKSNFQDILDENPPSLLKAMTWMGLCGGAATLIQIGLTIWTQPELRTLVTQMDRTALMITSGIVIAFVWILPAIGLLLNSAAVAFASTVVGGNVDIRAQAFLTAAWQAPLSLLASFIAFVPYVNLIGGAGLLIYQIVLNISATQAAQDLEGFQAIVSLVLSVVVMALPFCLLSLLAPMLGLNAGQAMQTLGR